MFPISIKVCHLSHSDWFQVVFEADGSSSFLTLKVSSKVIHDVVSNKLIHNYDTGHNG